MAACQRPNGANRRNQHSQAVETQLNDDQTESADLDPSEALAPAALELARWNHTLFAQRLGEVEAFRSAGPQPAPASAPKTHLPKTADDLLLDDLKTALARNDLFLVYQVQVDREGEQIKGVETLIRWKHPRKGMISPALFIPLAERHGLISQITSWVLDRLLVETRHLTGVQVAFNVSALEFADTGFVDRLSALIASHDYDPRRLEVEITETAILQNDAQVRSNMDRLHALGMQIALDDFGAGYSSLGQLRRYPFDKLKIDREFITDWRDMQAANIVHAVVSIGRALGMRVVAEGVETDTQRKFLNAAGVHAMQGYLFGEPVPLNALEHQLRRAFSPVQA